MTFETRTSARAARAREARMLRQGRVRPLAHGEPGMTASRAIPGWMLVASVVVSLGCSALALGALAAWLVGLGWP